MQGLQRGVVTAVLLAWCVTTAADQKFRSDSFGYSEPSPLRPALIAARTSKQLSLYGTLGLSLEENVIRAPGASFVKLHIGQFRLPDGVILEISNSDASEVWRYSNKDKDALTVDPGMGDDGKNSFSAMSITGDYVQVSLVGNLHLLDPAHHDVEIDSYMEGLPLGPSKLGDYPSDKFGIDEESHLENACGADERYDAACWASSNSWEYKRSAAVAKLITSRGEVCTAWRVGSDNHLFTAEHCLGSQTELSGAEIWFDYEAVACGSAQDTVPVKVAGGSLLARNQKLDYALFTVNNFSSVSGYPFFGLEVDSADLGEPIFIPQHGLGRSRQIALESDMNSSGECEVDALDLDGYSPGSDIGYYCDTTTSSSGAPVVSNISGRVLAIHHFGGCLNAGVSISKIWPEISSFFSGKVPGGGSGGSGTGSGSGDPTANFSFACDALDCAFDGSSSSDSDGQIDDYAWSFGDGETASGASLDHEFEGAGTYSVTLTVEDNEGNAADKTQSVTVTIPNEEPKANFSSSCVSTQCEFNGGSSSDSDGEVVYWKWTLGDGSTVYGQNVSHTYDDSGYYTVNLTVEDDQGASDSKNRTVGVTKSNEIPQAGFNVSCDERQCSFNGGASTDSDGAIDAWNWNFGDNSNASGQQVEHEYSAVGTFNVTLTVTDDAGASANSSKQVTVVETPENEAPTANFSFSCNELSCSFDARTSTDSDGDITAWTWDFGDGSSASGQQVVHSFNGNGSFGVTLVVADEDGASDSRSRTVAASQTEEAPNQAPEAVISFSCEETDCTFDASLSSDSDGSVTSWAWSFGDGSNRTGDKSTHTYGSAGTYNVTLTVTDDAGATDSRTQSVKVTEADDGNAPEAKFSYECDELSCRFDATSSRVPNGSLVKYQWSLGDGHSAADPAIDYQFADSGRFNVSLTVVDDKGRSDTQSSTIEVEKSKPRIALTGAGSSNNGRVTATLRWSGADTQIVELYRDGQLITRTSNDGKYIDLGADRNFKSAAYRLCQSDSSVCSETVVLQFGPKPGS